MHCLYPATSQDAYKWSYFNTVNCKLCEKTFLSALWTNCWQRNSTAGTTQRCTKEHTVHVQYIWPLLIEGIRGDLDTVQYNRHVSLCKIFNAFQTQTYCTCQQYSKKALKRNKGWVFMSVLIPGGGGWKRSIVANKVIYDSIFPR